MSIDRESLTSQQKTMYDMWVNFQQKDPDDPELANLLALVKAPKSRVRKQVEERKEVVRREAELVVLHLYNKKVPLTRNCKNCDEIFVTDYEYCWHCGDECLRRTLEKAGLAWNPEKTAEERWQAVQPPSIISPKALEVVMPVLARNAGMTNGAAKKIPTQANDPFADLF